MTAAAPTATAFERPVDRAAALAGRPGIVRFLDLAPVRAVMVDGDGPVGEAAFAPRMPALYATAWTLRFALKARGLLTKVAPLEGLYWTADGSTDLDRILGPDRGDWRWTLLIPLPDEATGDELAGALAKGRSKVGAEIAANVRIDTFDEGHAAQLLHLGPYERERPSLERLHAAIADAGLRPRGRHHEIYLGDPRRGDPEKVRTILRQPVEPV